ncbi:BREX-2 system phosphatase PglZ [Actinospica sp. MGRD01-02]|uniref:BREX-2 system phosphatase PglZ n=1 Tax=Actinospica acidithermotolerans TaxID=2828514 RepID=A0A941E400_9ACTN|nr:BREX-2 system phosphatase PglZ [Actinospica acidithermotolerans]MBR7825770.1 BREX-2 system phosphatase PglZ [Actinospica acidithermotolerans]
MSLDAATAPPRISRGTLESLVRKELRRKQSRRLFLVYVDYPTSQFSVVLEDEDEGAGSERYAVSVVACPSVLAVADAWEQFQREGERTPDGAPRVLVIATDLPAAEIGWSLRAHAAYMSTIAVNPAELVREQFGVRELDWRLARETWLLDALLAAEPQHGWDTASPGASRGSLLTRDSAVAALLAVRLGLGSLDGGGGAPDAGAVLEWSRGTGPECFAALPEAERAGVSAWLAEATGPVAAIVLRLAELGRARDAVALGLLCTALDARRGSAGLSDALLLLGALFGPGAPSAAELGTFAQAAEGTVHRWITATEGGGDRTGDLRSRVLDAVTRAEALAAGYPQLQAAFAASATLPTGFEARLTAFAAALTADQEAHSPASLERAEKAHRTLAGHRLAIVHPRRLAVAEMALRALRWLHTAGTEAQPAHVSGWLSRHLTDLGWLDRALTVLYHGDPDPGPDTAAAEETAAAYRSVYGRVRARRDALDRSFASTLAAWTGGEDAPSNSGTLLVEEVLDKVAARLATDTGRPPLVLVLDGMSSAVATEFGERLTRRNVFTEAAIAPAAGHSARMAAAAVIPSVTVYSRTSLLCGARQAGGQREEKDGFAAFWRARAGREALLFHKRDIGDELAGGRLSPALMSALPGEAVIGVVLNDVDDALDKGARGDRTAWTLENVTHFESLLDAARSFDRPVVLVSDHGHILDRSTANDVPTRTSSADKSQRYRSAEAEPASADEILLSGPRVMDCGGTLIAAVSEQVRYTARRAGYHGGAALAEMTVPVLVFLPEGMPVPKGWTALAPWRPTPRWWSTLPVETDASGAAGTPLAAPVPEPPKPAGPRKSTKPVQHEALFPLPADDAASAPAQTAEPVKNRDAASVGAAVVASAVYRDQKKFVLKMKDEEVIAAIDALHGGDRTLPASVLAEIVGRSGTSFDGFLANLERLLNIDQYPVLSRIDSGRTVRLDFDLLAEQFSLGRIQTGQL